MANTNEETGSSNQALFEAVEDGQRLRRELIEELGLRDWVRDSRKLVINSYTQQLLVDHHTEHGESPDENPMVVARWFSLDGTEYFGLEICPDRPSVVWGCVRMDEPWGNEWEFSSFWVVREEGNSLSHGEALEDQRLLLDIDGEVFHCPRWELDTNWEPIKLDELTKKMEAKEGKLIG